MAVLFVMIVTYAACFHATVNCDNRIHEEDVNIGDLSTLLNSLGTTVDINGLLSLFNDAHAVTTFVATLRDASPVIRDIEDKMIHANPKARVIYKIINGETPYIADIFSLTTGGSHDLSETWKQVSKANSNFQQLKHAAYQANPNYENISNLLFGHDNSWTNGNDQLTNKKYTVISARKATDRIQTEMIRFFVDNLSQFGEVFKQLQHNPIAYTPLLETFVHLDYTHFPKSAKSGSNMPGSKYTVIEDKGDNADAEITLFLDNAIVSYPELLNEKESNNDVENEVRNYLSTLIDILNYVLMTSL